MPLLVLLKTKSIFPKMLRFSSRWRQYAAWNKVREEAGFRSGYEAEVQKRLPEGVLYESIKIPYHIELNANYTPDWIMPSQCILIEAKGEFRMEDRNKMLILKREYPDLDIRLLFQNPRTKLRKGAVSTYEDWCRKNGFPCAKGPGIPEEWLKHKPTAKQKCAFERIMTPLKKK